ncbi:hemolysin A /rRNA methyltransferase, TlyA-like [Desulfonema limicola]|uniref:Hemolysin A /rRNA methyltransferase, TlyA-like n=1 Tax=Desulfonema limicola TaxID=45656 RepID=A0A975GGM9_9BACT|nr:TlyA family RNA methyltransferase [Desulfonema limicola]QTA80428.1 hemolysin A /rRNA methyltransferase, TlyA-like [Desulfonema limicola]
MAGKKKRLDIHIVEKGLALSRQRAQALIMAGKILVDNLPVDKPGTLVSEQAVIDLKGRDIPYVSRGGLKLEAALKQWDIRVKGFVCLDVGASTGGFTDCLLQNGVSRVYAVDVGYGQLAWKLRQDKRVIPIERTNIRYLTEDALPEKVDLVTIDTSFISLKLVIPCVLKFMKKESQIFALIKPQFEVGKGKVGKGGVVRDPMLHDEVICSLSSFFTKLNLLKQSIIPSPVLGPKGNKEFIISLKYES